MYQIYFGFLMRNDSYQRLIMYIKRAYPRYLAITLWNRKKVIAKNWDFGGIQYTKVSGGRVALGGILQYTVL
jgi:hypothetical protein